MNTFWLQSKQSATQLSRMEMTQGTFAWYQHEVKIWVRIPRYITCWAHWLFDSTSYCDILHIEGPSVTLSSWLNGVQWSTESLVIPTPHYVLYSMQTRYEVHDRTANCKVLTEEFYTPLLIYSEESGNIIMKQISI